MSTRTLDKYVSTSPVPVLAMAFESEATLFQTMSLLISVLSAASHPWTTSALIVHTFWHCCQLALKSEALGLLLLLAESTRMLGLQDFHQQDLLLILLWTYGIHNYIWQTYCCQRDIECLFSCFLNIPSFSRHGDGLEEWSRVKDNVFSREDLKLF